MAAGSTLRFNSNFTLNAGSSFSTTGLIELASSTLTLARGTAFAPTTNFTFTNGTLTGADDFNIGSGITANWRAGTMSGTGTTRVLAGGTLNLLNNDNPVLTNRSLTNAGTVNSNTSSYLILNGSGGSLTNLSGGLWDFKNNNVFNVTGTWAFDNQAGATLRKSTTTGDLPFNLPLTNAGTVEVKGGSFTFTSSFTNNGGTLKLDGGNFSFANPLSMGTGTIIGNGTITAVTTTTGGLISPGGPLGTLNIAGNLSLQSTSIALFELGGMTQGTTYDFLSVSGSAVLDGTLQLKFANSFASTIQPTDTFLVISATTLSNMFSNVATTGLRLSTTDGLGSFQVNYVGNTVTLTNFVASPVPEPSTYAALFGSAVLVFAVVRRRRRT